MRNISQLPSKYAFIPFSISVCLPLENKGDLVTNSNMLSLVMISSSYIRDSKYLKWKPKRVLSWYNSLIKFPSESRLLLSIDATLTPPFWSTIDFPKLST